MNYCFENYDDVKEKALNLMKINRDKFTLDKMTEKLDEITHHTLIKFLNKLDYNYQNLKKLVTQNHQKLNFQS